MMKIILTESLDTTLDYYMDAGTCARGPLPTYLTFLVWSNYKSKFRWHVILLNQIGNLLP